jgi:hypothetical protein
VKLQIASVYCISNLVTNSNDDTTATFERQMKLKEMGAHRILHKLLQTNNLILFDKVKQTLEQFNNSASSASASSSSSSSNNNLTNIN